MMTNKERNKEYEKELLKLRERLEEMETYQKPAPTQPERTFDRYNELFETLKDNMIKKIEESFIKLNNDIKPLKTEQSTENLPEISEIYNQIFYKVNELEETILNMSTLQGKDNMESILGDIVSLQDN
ncbi:MAG: hypothetical protein L3V56_14765, partial [Candidatus Magnetoovum sp. WYHC-5]|nr:hypothetical protein [Candidatus Magnetoovum sp. WYHC-5]